MPRDPVTAIISAMSDLLVDAVHAELMTADSPQSPSEARFAQQLFDSASLQHLLLISVAAECHRLHQQLRGVSLVKAKTAAAVVTASAAVAAAAAAAEAAGSGNQQQHEQPQEQQQQPRYLTIPDHHTAVLDMLLAPAAAEELMPGGRPKRQLQYTMVTALQLLLQPSASGSSSSNRGLRVVTQLPRVPVQMCLPLHLLLFEAAALAPELPSIHTALIFQLALLDVYEQAKIGEQPTPDAINAAAAAYGNGLTASLLLMGPALLHAYKHDKQGDMELPAGSGGCPTWPGGVPLRGAALRDAAVNLFGSLTVRMCPPGVQDVLNAAFQQQPFTAAAVCEAAVRGAARHNQLHATQIRLVAALTTAACNKCIALPGESSSSSSVVAAAAADAGLRDALLLPFGLITTQLKQAAGSVDGAGVISALVQRSPSVKAVTKLSKQAEASVGMDSDGATGGLSSSSTSSSRVGNTDAEGCQAASDIALGTLAPWLALAGRCFSMGQLGEMQLGLLAAGCSDCMAAKYCSRKCQVEHWKIGHQGVCKRIKAAAAAAAAAAGGGAAGIAQ
uniref:MYND-type domain-containing protein n=1 Tax=Tetradesmus obliquus TaxID=3088 RepID=A0A383W035_TETOB|eukprot:jgi/Sobl393_1/16622/SZX70841.1